MRAEFGIKVADNADPDGFGHIAHSSLEHSKLEAGWLHFAVGD
jgi:hypothetical protein